MTDLVTEAQRLQQLLDKLKWPFCFIGGLAVQVWGQPRVTLDIDLTLISNFVDDEKFVDTLLMHYRGRISDAREFALKQRVLILETESHIGIDVSLGALPFENELVERALDVKYTSDISLRTCTAEDLIVLKAVASRPRDWSDIEGVVVKQTKLGWNEIESRLLPFSELLDVPEILRRLADLRRHYQGS
jgi:predicted nucleotidyltransferase